MFKKTKTWVMLASMLASFAVIPVSSVIQANQIKEAKVTPQVTQPAPAEQKRNDCRDKCPLGKCSFQSSIITNTNDSQKISVVIKWDDDQNRDKLRPNQINIQLLANWQVVGEKYAYEGNQWQVDFTKLPIYENGQKIKYTVLEDLVNGYQATLEQKDNNFIIINKHEVALTTIAGKVVWDDQNDVNHIRPTAVNVTLYANGKEVTTIPVTADWKFTFKDLPMNENGKPIVYTIGQNVIKDYTTKIDQNTYTIVNRHLQPTKPVKPKEPTKPVKPKEPTKPVKPVLPKTGMNANDLMAFIGWIFLITAGGFMLLKRKLTN